jgi:fructoselysine 6-kinase
LEALKADDSRRDEYGSESRAVIDRAYSQKALATGKVVDATGCGDAFQAAFTASYFATKDIRAALWAGAELAMQPR